MHTQSSLMQCSGARDRTVHRLHVELIDPADAHADALVQALHAPQR